MIFSGLEKKNEIGKNQSGDPIKQDINLVWPYYSITFNYMSMSVCITIQAV